MELLIAVLVFTVYSAIREVMYWKQITKLEELVKAKDLFEYYKGNKSNTVNDTNKGKDGIATPEQNTILLDDSRPFDLPSDMKVQWEDETAIQSIKIYK